MDDYTAVAIAEGFEEGTEEQQLEAWQHLIDTDLAWSLRMVRTNCNTTY